MRLCDTQTFPRLQALFSRYELQLQRTDDAAPIPGSYWGAPEAGIVETTVHVRPDTPLHSALHEAAHVLCVDGERRRRLHTDAGGNCAEENAVCYLQILLALKLGISVGDICADMDAWGYTFRLGSALAWFAQDAEDARGWLRRHGLITCDGKLTWRRRETASSA
jgi:hypothetical protein